MMKQRKVCVVTGTRAEYGLLRWVMEEIRESTSLELQVIATGMHLSPEFGLTYREIEQDGFGVLVKEDDAERLDGATVDYVDRVNESGFEVRLADSHAPGGAARSGAEPTGEIADRVRDVLDSQVNPAIAAHGGMISLVEVQETDVYVEMSGGCQGCALSRMTLRQGVERMLREAVPELTAVHDVTDHASGDNPYL